MLYFRVHLQKWENDERWLEIDDRFFSGMIVARTRSIYMH
jgi:hypothetical protein